MKNILLSFASMLLTMIVLTTSAQQVPNPSFENWTTITFFEEPDTLISTNWQAYILTDSGNVAKTTDANSGNYAIRLNTVASGNDTLPGTVFLAASGSYFTGSFTPYPYTSRPDSIAGYFKGDFQTNDTGIIFNIFFWNGNILGLSESLFSGTVNSYTRFADPIQWFAPSITPDSVLTIISSSNFIQGNFKEGSILYLDDLEFINGNRFPNNGFEHWTPVNSEEPDGWTSSNFLYLMDSARSVTKTSDSYHGSYALRIETSVMSNGDTTGFITNGSFSAMGEANGMPVNNNPHRLTGFYKYTPSGMDTGVAYLETVNFSGGTSNTLDSGVFKFTSQSTFTAFDINLTYSGSPMADTAFIAFASSNLLDETNLNVGSVLIVDSLYLYYKTTTGEVGIPVMNVDHTIYPNPASDVLIIEVREFETRDMEIRLFDMSGRSVKKNDVMVQDNGNIRIDLTGLESGTYFYQLKSNNGSVISGHFQVVQF